MNISASKIFKSNLLKISLLLLVMASMAMPLRASVKITGKITDENNEPLEFASIKVQGTRYGASSDLEGRYTLTVPEADTIRVVFSCIGYEESKRRLVGAKGEVTLNVKLLPKTYDLGQVTVTDIQKQTGAVQKINIDNVRLTPSVGAGGVETLLTTMPGVNSSNELSAQYSVRGGAFDENSVYINGVEVYRPQLITSGAQEGLSIINPDLAGSVGFSSGGYGAQYGDKMSSVLDITYREPQKFEGSVSGSLMGGSLAVGASSKRFSMLHGLRYKSNSSLLSSMEDKGEYDPRYFDYQTSMGVRISDKWKASVLGNIAINNYKFIPESRTTNFGTSENVKQFKVYFDGKEKDRFETFFGAFTLNYKPNKANEFTLLASGFLTNELVTYDISGEYWLDQAGTSGEGGIGGELGVGRYLEHARNRFKATVMTLGLQGATGISHHNFSYGVSFRHDNIRDRSREWEMRDSAGFSLPNDPDALKVIYNMFSDNNLGSNRFAGFVQDNWRIDTKAGYFNILAGIRGSYWDFNKEFLFSPRVSVGFIPDKFRNWSFRVAGGIYYQSPFYKEFKLATTDVMGNTTVTLNKDIKSQRSLQAILGADYVFRAFDRPFKLSAEAYYKHITDMIPYEIDNLKLEYAGRNSSKGHVAGIDLKLFGQFVPGSDSWISFSLMNTSMDLDGKKVPMPNDQRYSFALFFTDYFPKLPMLKFSLRGVFSDGLTHTAPHTSRAESWFRAPAYKRVDIGLSYGLLTPLAPGREAYGIRKYIKSVWLGADIFNLFDISNVSGYYWVTDVNNIQYAVPNYLTRRQFNIKLTVDF